MAGDGLAPGPDEVARFRRIHALAERLAGELGRDEAQMLGAEILAMTERRQRQAGAEDPSTT